MLQTFAFALVAVFSGVAAAQQPVRPDPADPAVRVPRIEYVSTFEAYRAHAEPELSPWRVVNEEVERVGGHVGVLRAAAQAKKNEKQPASHGAAHRGHK